MATRIPRSTAGRTTVGAAQVRGQVLAPTPVDAVPGGMPTGGTSGNGFSGLAEVIEKFRAADTENEIQKGRVNVYSQLRDAETELMQEATEPNELVRRWDERVEGIRKGLTEQYQNREAVLNKVLPSFDDFASQRVQHVRNQAFKLTIDKVKADGLQNDNTLLGSLGKASSPADFDHVLSLQAEDVDSKLATGAYGAVEAEKRKLGFAADVEKLRTAYTEEQRLNGVHSTLARQFGKSPNSAVKFLENPENWEKLGIGHRDALHFIGVFDSQAARDKRRADEAREAGARTEMNAYWQAVDKGDLDGAATVLSRARSISGKELVSMKQALKKDDWADDPRVVADVQKRIWSGEITDAGQIAPLMGNGLSPKTAKSLRDDMDKIGKESPPFTGAMNFYSNALERYKAMYEGTDLAGNESTFAATLAYQARQKGIGPFDPRMDSLADEILAVAEKTWFGRDTTRFEQQLKDKSLPGVPTSSEAPSPMPSARTVPAPKAKPSSIQQIPRAEYDMVKQALAKAGRDTSDETVLSVWLANRDKLKGAK